jgi:hypothetical protein
MPYQYPLQNLSWGSISYYNNSITSQIDRILSCEYNEIYMTLRAGYKKRILTLNQTPKHKSVQSLLSRKQLPFTSYTIYKLVEPQYAPFLYQQTIKHISSEMINNLQQKLYMTVSKFQFELSTTSYVSCLNIGTITSQFQERS